MARVVAFVDDLFFLAKIQGAAHQAGIELDTVSSSDALIECVHPLNGTSRDLLTLIIVDLNAHGGAIEALERLRAAGNTVPVVSYLSHVQVELAERARGAGCAQVLPRSAFTRDLPKILEEAKDRGRNN